MNDFTFALVTIRDHESFLSLKQRACVLGLARLGIDAPVCQGVTIAQGFATNRADSRGVSVIESAVLLCSELVDPMGSESLRCWNAYWQVVRLARLEMPSSPWYLIAIR